jgi:protein MpaA
MSARNCNPTDDDLAGSPVGEALRWRAAHRVVPSRLPFGLRRMECPRVPGSGPLIKVGVFAGIHGDEPAGTLAVHELAAWARRLPEELAGVALNLFPVCNPTGQRAGTRHSRSGLDLNREFWTGSDQPEVKALETELRNGRYDIIISLHENDTSGGIYGFAGGTSLSHRLLEPALVAASTVLPRNQSPIIDGFPADDGIISEGYGGILSAPPEQRPKAIEIVFETPALAAQARRVVAALLAVQAILKASRSVLVPSGSS